MLAKRTEVKFEKIVNIINKYKTPELQRLIDNKHIEEMVKDQKIEYEKYKVFSILQSFTIAMIKSENTGYLLDGQHRIEVFSRLEKEGYNINNVVVPIVIYNVDNYNDVEDYFTKINKHSPIEPVGNIINYERDLCQMLLNNFTKAYICDDKDEARCPNISMKKLIMNIRSRNIKEKLETSKKTIKNLYDVIISVNDFLELKSSDQIIQDNKYSRCLKKSQKENCNPCYLGTFNNFEWLDFSLYLLLNDLNINEVGTSHLNNIINKKKRANIKGELREKVWKKFNLNICDKGYCYTCNNELHFKEMECGHIIAHSLGGNETFENLMPICKTCNTKMGIMNLEEYKVLQDIILKTKNI